MNYIKKKLKYLDKRVEKWLKRSLYLFYIMLGIELIMALIMLASK